MILNLLQELDKIPETDIVCPGDEDVQPGDKVVGIVGLRAQKLFAVVGRMVNLVKAKVEALSSPKDLTPAKKKEIESDVKTADLLRDLFWQEVEEETGTIGQSLTIKNGWMLVATPEPERNEIPRIVIAMGFPSGCNDPNCLIHGKKR